MVSVEKDTKDPELHWTVMNDDAEAVITQVCAIVFVAEMVLMV